MPAKILPSRLTSQAAVTRHLRRLIEIDPRLRTIHEAVGIVPPRSRPPGFAGLARVVCGQQVSVASADAIWKRLEAVAEATTPEGASCAWASAGCRAWACRAASSGH